MWRRPRVTATDVVEVARALAELPAIAAAAAEGRFSFDQLRPLCAFATPGTDAHWGARLHREALRDLACQAP